MAIDSVKYPEYIRIDELHVLKNTQEHLLFIDRTRNEMYYFSEVLKNEIQEAGCTGIEFELVEIG